MLEIFESEYWAENFNETFGYLLYAENFGGYDLANARYRYGMEMDPRLAELIVNRIMSLDKEEMWSGIVAGREDFYNDDWRGYKEKGRETREKALVKLITAKGYPSSLSYEQVMAAKQEASRELLNAGFYVPLGKKVVGDKMPPKVDYTDYRVEGELDEW